MIAGIVLAAGRGRRFGATKQLAPLRGRPLLQHAIDAMVAVAAVDRVLLVLGHEADRIAAAVEPGRAEVVVAEEWEEGMAASLRAGVAAAADAEAVVVTLGDQPLLTPAVIAAALDHRRPGVPGVRAAYDGVRGHPVVLERSLFPAVASLRGEAGARALLDGAVVFEAGHLASGLDVDTPRALEVAR